MVETHDESLRKTLNAVLRALKQYTINKGEKNGNAERL